MAAFLYREAELTCIAWDGKNLAADKQSTSSGYATTVTKVFRVDGCLVGLMGNAGHASALLGWFCDGRDPEKWPKAHGESAGALFIDESGKAFGYSGDDGPHSFEIESKFTAFGCGRDYALAAMHLGKSAREAVLVACELDVNCGCGVDTLEL